MSADVTMSDSSDHANWRFASVTHKWSVGKTAFISETDAGHRLIPGPNLNPMQDEVSAQ